MVRASKKTTLTWRIMMKIFLSLPLFIEALKNGFDLSSNGWIAIFAVEWKVTCFTLEKMVEEAGVDPTPLLIRLYNKERIHMYTGDSDEPIVRTANVQAMLDYYLQKDLGKQLHREHWSLFDSLPEEMNSETLAKHLSELDLPLEIVA